MTQKGEVTQFGPSNLSLRRCLTSLHHMYLVWPPSCLANSSTKRQKHTHHTHVTCWACFVRPNFRFKHNSQPEFAKLQSVAVEREVKKVPVLSTIPKPKKQLELTGILGREVRAATRRNSLRSVAVRAKILTRLDYVCL